MSPGELWKIQQGNARRSAIHVIEFGVGGDMSPDSFLKQLARQNRGVHRYHDVTHH